ncbi:hypothetical protein R6Q59_022967 [Mikania micrantha]
MGCVGFYLDNYMRESCVHLDVVADMINKLIHSRYDGDYIFTMIYTCQDHPIALGSFFYRYIFEDDVNNN